jgi:4-hydroxy-3-polyprenylbenzoate decarboxylase
MWSFVGADLQRFEKRFSSKARPSQSSTRQRFRDAASVQRTRNFRIGVCLDFAELRYPYTPIPVTKMAKTGRRVITVGLTGASGAIYARHVLRMLDADSSVGRVFLVISDAGLRSLATELDIVASDSKKLPSLLTGTAAAKIESLPNRDIGASIASGSAIVDAMIIVPCSAGALGSIGSGIANDLLTRAAEVCLKERRPLILCLRETPLQRNHLENMVRLHDAGATVMPATPAFYYGPQTIDDIVDQFSYRVLAQAGLPQKKQYRWKGRP